MKSHTPPLWMLALTLALGLALGASGCDDDSNPGTDTQADTLSTLDQVEDMSADSAETTTSDVPPDISAELPSDAESDVPELDTALDTVADVLDEEVTAPPELDESEPNNGATLTEYNDLPLSAVMNGTIGEASDRDIFKFEATPGHVYVAVLAPAPGSPYQAHLTTIDAGRGGANPGDDYVKIASSPDSLATLELLAMGEGGYLLAVRDLSDLQGSPDGGPDFAYQLTVVEQDPQLFQGQALTLSDSIDDTLSSPGAIRLYPFTGTEGQNFSADLVAAGMDGRLIVFAESTGDWVARSSGGSSIDAPIFASGPMLLVVENIAETATVLGYHLSVSSP